jgi:hypothetical protein
MNLYETTIEGLEIQRLLEDSGGELDEALEARFDALLSGGKEIITAALCVRRNLMADAEACRIEAQRLWERQKGLEKQVASLEARVLGAVIAAFGGKLKTPLFSVWTQTSPATRSYALAPDVDMVKLAETRPDIVRTTRELSKSSLNDLVKAGELPPEIVSEEIPGHPYLRVK